MDINLSKEQYSEMYKEASHGTKNQDVGLEAATH